MKTISNISTSVGGEPTNAACAPSRKLLVIVSFY